MVVCCMPNGCGPRGFMLRSRTTDYRALERACEVRPSLVVTDLDIPGIDGFELTRRAGCDSVLRKPCGADDLYSSINDLMRQRAENR